MAEKKSQFTTVSTVSDNRSFNVFGQNVDEQISKPDLFNQIRDEIYSPFIYPTVELLQAADLEADEDFPTYVWVEENQCRLYKITSLAAGVNDIELDNGATATYLPVADSPTVVETFADLATTPAPTAGMIVYTKQHTSGGIGGGYFQDTAGTITNNGGTLINSTVTTGRHWKAIDYQSLTLQMFGVLSSLADCGPAVQLAINAAQGKPLYDSEGGTFVFTTPVEYDTTGLGVVEGLKIIGIGKRKTIFDNRTGGPLITLTSGTSTSDFQKNALLSSFSITNSTGDTGTKGIFLEGVFDSKMENVLVEDQDEEGVLFYSTVGDATDCYNWDVKFCIIQNNGADGILIDAPTSINANINIKNNTIQGNAGRAISAYSLVSSEFSENAFAYNLGGGIFIGRRVAGNYSKVIEIKNNEFDSNAGKQIELDHVFSVKESNNYYVVNNSSPVVTHLLYITANAFNVTSEKASPRVPVSYTGITAFDIAAGCAKIEIRNPEWTSWQTSGNTKYANLASDTIILDESLYTTPVYAVGMKFPATRVPSSDANTLDDYQEVALWSTTFSSLVNITGTPTLTGAYCTQIGDRVFIEGQIDLTATATGATSLTFVLPVVTKNLISSSVGIAVEVNQLAIGVVYDTSGLANNLANLYFPSLNIGARNVKFSLMYATT